MSKKSRVDPRLTKHPVTGKTVCGAFKRTIRQEMYDLNYTVEDLLADRKKFERYVCQNSPTIDGNNNGRCRFDGGRQGRPVVTGKYSKVFPQIDVNDLQKKHSNLNPELELITGMIDRRLEDDTEQVNIKKIRELIPKIKKQFENANFTIMRGLIKELEETLEATTDQKKTEKETRELLQEYASIFKVEIQNRKNNEEFIHVKQVLNYNLLVITTLKTAIDSFIQDKDLRDSLLSEVRLGIAGAVTRTNIFGANSNENEEVIEGELVGYNDPNQTTTSYPLSLESNAT